MVKPAGDTDGGPRPDNRLRVSTVGTSITAWLGRVHVVDGAVAIARAGRGFRERQEALHSCSNGPAVEPGEGQMGNVGLE